MLRVVAGTAGNTRTVIQRRYVDQIRALADKINEVREFLSDIATSGYPFSGAFNRLVHYMSTKNSFYARCPFAADEAGKLTG